MSEILNASIRIGTYPSKLKIANNNNNLYSKFNLFTIRMDWPAGS